VLPLGDCYAFACRATDPQTLGNLADRIAPIFDLRDGIAFELFCEFSSGHIVLLASKITKQSVYKSRGYSVRFVRQSRKEAFPQGHGWVGEATACKHCNPSPIIQHVALLRLFFRLSQFLGDGFQVRLLAAI
jgi:hypothetical protein